ncbi:FAD-binding protein [Siminovitchia fortis]|uniref:FAD-binding protein n=1 Tax=Siminovitchia fortis TaxID=254758 RepID=UPI0036F3C39C
MNKKIFVILLILFIGSYGAFFVYSFQHKDSDERLMTDVGRLVPVKVREVVQGQEVDQMKDLLKEAKDKNLKISIAGKQHSQGGHTYYKDAIVMDMTTYNKVLK